VGAGQGQLIAIVGNNLQDADGGLVQRPAGPHYANLHHQNQPAGFGASTDIPTSVNNKLKIIFKNGYELLHDFQVQISKPVVTSMLSEFVNEGDIATIYGNFFYEPVTVTFTGGATGTVVARKDAELQVQVPAGAQPGPITIRTNFGQVTSTFWFRDNRNLIISGDPHEGWWGKYLVTAPNTAMAIPPKSAVITTGLKRR
jgi:hypothetical protein